MSTHRFEELLQKVEHVVGDACLVVVVARAVREARASRLVDVQEVSALVPREGVARRARTVSIYLARAVLAEERDLGRAARPTRQPEHRRRALRCDACGEVPVKVVLAGARAQGKEAAVLLDIVAQPSLDTRRAWHGREVVDGQREKQPEQHSFPSFLSFPVKKIRR